MSFFKYFERYRNDIFSILPKVFRNTKDAMCEYIREVYGKRIYNVNVRDNWVKPRKDGDRSKRGELVIRQSTE